MKLLFLDEAELCHMGQVIYLFFPSSYPYLLLVFTFRSYDVM